jgi:uncharacterized protein DUF4194
MKSIQDRLKAKNVRPEDFQAVNALLISRGFLSRDDSVRHRALYMIAQRCQDEIQDVLAFVYGASLFHDPATSHFRLQPFGARDVGLPDIGEEMEIRRELKGSVLKDFTAALLTLKLLYDELIVERKMGPGGRVAVRVTEFVTAMNVNFKVDLPAADFHRKAIFMKLKKHGVADFNIDELKDEDAVISIRPEIGSLVFDSAVAAAVAAAGQSGRNSGDGEELPADADDLEMDAAQ